MDSNAPSTSMPHLTLPSKSSLPVATSSRTFPSLNNIGSSRQPHPPPDTETPDNIAPANLVSLTKELKRAWIALAKLGKDRELKRKGLVCAECASIDLGPGPGLGLGMEEPSLSRNGTDPSLHCCSDANQKDSITSNQQQLPPHHPSEPPDPPRPPQPQQQQTSSAPLRALALDNARMRVQLTKHGEEKKRLEGLVEAARNEVGKAEEETTRAKEDGTRLGKAVHALEKDRQMLRHRLTSVEAEVTRLQSRLEDSETFKIELERQRDEASSKASQAESLYANLRTDHNTLLSRLLSQHLDLRSRSASLRALQHALDLARSEAEQSLREGKGERVRLERMVEGLRREVDGAEERMGREGREKGEMALLIREQSDRIREHESRSAKLEHAVSEATHERDTLRTQLTTLQSTLSTFQSESHHLTSQLFQTDRLLAEKTEALTRATLEIRRLRADRNGEEEREGKVRELKGEVGRLEALLNKERVRCRALEEELSTPLNIHRFRTLPSTDPPLAEALSKLSLLQKRLIARSDEVEKLENELGKMKMEKEEWVGRYERAVKVWEGRGRERGGSKSLESEVEMYKAQLEAAQKELEAFRVAGKDNREAGISRPGSRNKS